VERKGAALPGKNPGELSPTCSTDRRSMRGAALPAFAVSLASSYCAPEGYSDCCSVRRAKAETQQLGARLSASTAAAWRSDRNRPPCAVVVVVVVVVRGLWSACQGRLTGEQFHKPGTLL
jgi:hypothetical protein